MRYILFVAFAVLASCGGTAECNKENVTEVAAESAEAVADNDLRLYNMEVPFHLSMVEWSDEHVELARNMDFYRPTQWQACDGENVRGFSAVAYNFGKMLREQGYRLLSLAIVDSMDDVTGEIVLRAQDQ